MSIKAKAITKIYAAPSTIQGKIIAVKNTSIDINLGSRTIIYGPTGSGKTTLLILLSGILLPTRGDIVFDNLSSNGSPLSAISTFRLKNIGYIPQKPLFINEYTVIENILSPHSFLKVKHGELQKYAYELLERFGLAEKAKSFISQLSGGEIKKILFIRAIVKNPRYIFADEPVSELDNESAKEVLRVLHEKNRNGSAIIIASHRPLPLGRSVDIYQMKNGEIVDYRKN